MQLFHIHHCQTPKTHWQNGGWVVASGGPKKDKETYFYKEISASLQAYNPNITNQQDAEKSLVEFLKIIKEEMKDNFDVKVKKDTEKGIFLLITKKPPGSTITQEERGKINHAIKSASSKRNKLISNIIKKEFSQEISDQNTKKKEYKKFMLGVQYDASMTSEERKKRLQDRLEKRPEDDAPISLEENLKHTERIVNDIKAIDKRIEKRKADLQKMSTDDLENITTLSPPPSRPNNTMQLFRVDYENNGASVSAKDQANKIIQEIEDRIQKGERVAITYSANSGQSQQIRDGYQQNTFPLLQGDNQARVFEIIADHFRNHGKKHMVRILPISTLTYDAQQNKHPVTDDIFNLEMRNIATHLGAGWSVLGLQNQKSDPHELAVGGIIAGPLWNQHKDKFQDCVEQFISGKYTDPALQTAYTATGKRPLPAAPISSDSRRSYLRSFSDQIQENSAPLRSLSSLPALPVVPSFTRTHKKDSPHAVDTTSPEDRKSAQYILDDDRKTAYSDTFSGNFYEKISYALTKSSGDTLNEKLQTIIPLVHLALDGARVEGDTEKSKFAQTLSDMLLSLQALNKTDSHYTLAHFSNTVEHVLENAPPAERAHLRSSLSSLVQDNLVIESPTRKSKIHSFASSPKEQSFPQTKMRVKIEHVDHGNTVTGTFSYQRKKVLGREQYKFWRSRKSEYQEFRDQIKDFANVTIHEYKKGTAEHPLNIQFPGYQQPEAALALLLEYKKRAVLENREFWTYNSEAKQHIKITPSENLQGDELAYFLAFAQAKPELRASKNTTQETAGCAGYKLIKPSESGVSLQSKDTITDAELQNFLDYELAKARLERGLIRNPLNSPNPPGASGMRI